MQNRLRVLISCAFLLLQPFTACFSGRDGNQVSFISLANKSNLIRLIYSDNSRVKMKSKIMKAAASLNIVTSKHSPYKTFRSKEII